MKTRPTLRALAALTASLSATLVASACTVVGAGQGDGPPVSTPRHAPVRDSADASAAAPRIYGGSVTFSADRIPMVLEVSPSARGVAAHLSIPSLALDAAGEGRADGDLLALDLDYSGPCPGRLTLRARFVEVARRIEGRLIAKDCTGEEAGDVLLLLRPAGVRPEPWAPGGRDNSAVRH